MKHLQRLILDLIIEIVEAGDRTARLFRKKPKASLLVHNIHWFNNTTWLDQVFCFKQEDLWISNKH